MTSKFKPQLSLHIINLAPEGHSAGWGASPRSGAGLRRGRDRSGVNVSDHVVFGEALDEYAKPEVGGREGRQAADGA